MSKDQTGEVGCTSNSWIKDNYLVWYRATIYHNNLSSVVKEFCGDACRFPSCFSAVIRSDEAEKSITVLPHGDGKAQERAIARALADGLLPDPKELENRLNQMRLWLSDQDKESGK